MTYRTVLEPEIVRSWYQKANKKPNLTPHFVTEAFPLSPEVPPAFPSGPGSLEFTLSAHFLAERFHIVIATTSINVNGTEVNTPGEFAIPELVADEEYDDDGGGEVGLEEVGGVWGAADREECNVELGDHAEADKAETNP